MTRWWDRRWALIEQDTMLAESGLAVCEWITAFEAKPLPEKLKARVKRLEELADHERVCPTCLARESYAQAHCPPLPEPPVPLWMKGARHLVALAERLPVWAQPAVHVGAAFGACSLFRIVFSLPRIVAHPRLGLTALAGLLLSVTIGAAVGALYGGGKHVWARVKARRIADDDNSPQQA
ncbi:MAG: hypothetical protein ACJ79A_06390 [Gemmatimonadaceae bacterium]